MQHLHHFGVIIAGPCIPYRLNARLGVVQIRNGNYLYTQDLLALDSHRPLRDSPTSGAQYDSPLVWEGWAQLLEHHPDRRFVEYILTGIRQGFRIGFNRDQRLRNATCNLPSQVPAVISEYLARKYPSIECLRYHRGFGLGTFTSAP